MSHIGIPLSVKSSQFKLSQVTYSESCKNTIKSSQVDVKSNQVKLSYEHAGKSSMLKMKAVVENSSMLLFPACS